ncbi:MAG: hypothetical protein PWQ22_69 [Archaeoglobaceae archaeon]|nr:hypothetical protein [Archaeoglobaceae archaeon]MDK2875659.1 hypothetical protein [Archaeoglobaceae archaeon]
MDVVDVFVKLVGSAPWYNLIGMKIKRDESEIFVEINVEEKHLQALWDGSWWSHSKYTRFSNWS